MSSSPARQHQRRGRDSVNYSGRLRGAIGHHSQCHDRDTSRNSRQPIGIQIFSHDPDLLCDCDLLFEHIGDTFRSILQFTICDKSLQPESSSGPSRNPDVLWSELSSTMPRRRARFCCLPWRQRFSLVPANGLERRVTTTYSGKCLPARLPQALRRPWLRCRQAPRSRPNASRA